MTHRLNQKKAENTIKVVFPGVINSMANQVLPSTMSVCLQLLFHFLRYLRFLLHLLLCFFNLLLLFASTVLRQLFFFCFVYISSASFISVYFPIPLCLFLHLLLFLLSLSLFFVYPLPQLHTLYTSMYSSAFLLYLNLTLCALHLFLSSALVSCFISPLPSFAIPCCWNNRTL